MSDETLARLASTIRARRAESADRSYTRQLLDSGTARCARKLGEEAVETVVAAIGESDDALKGEAADVIFHLAVLLESRGLSITDAVAVLDARMGTSGLAEKAARKTP